MLTRIEGTFDAFTKARGFFKPVHFNHNIFAIMTRFSVALILLASALAGCGEKANAPTSTTAQTSAPPSAQTDAAPSQQQTRPATHQASGSIEAVDPVAGTLRIHHGPVASLGWPAMTMDFVVSDKALLNNVKSGQNIDFDFYDRNGDYVVTSIKTKQ